MILSLAVASLLLFRELGTVPGLHADEAWAGLRAQAILEGSRPWLGMNQYTGPLHQYLVALLIGWLGPSVQTLRLPGAFFALLSIPFYYYLVKRLFDRTIASIAVLTLVLSPFFVIYSRLAWESLALGPILALGATFLLAHDDIRLRPRQQCLAGALLGLGVWNHLLFLCVPVALLGVAALKWRKGEVRAKDYFWCFAGLSSVLLTRWSIGRSMSMEGASWSAPEVIAGSASRLAEWPAILADITHGDLLFARIVGETRSPTWSILPLISSIGAVSLLFGRGPGTQERRLVAAFAACFLTSLVISPLNSDRYFLFSLFFLPVFAAHGILSIKRRGIPVYAVAVAACALWTLQYWRIEANLFRAFRETGGVGAKLHLGSMPETSNHFLATESLYRKITELGRVRVVGDPFIVRPLQFFDRADHRLSFADYEGGQDSPEGPTVALLYAQGYRSVSPRSFPGWTTLTHDRQFIVLAAPSARLPSL